MYLLHVLGARLEISSPSSGFDQDCAHLRIYELLHIKVTFTYRPSPHDVLCGFVSRGAARSFMGKTVTFVGPNVQSFEEGIDHYCTTLRYGHKNLLTYS